MARLIFAVALVFVGALVHGEERDVARLDDGNCGIRPNVPNNGAGELVVSAKIVGGQESVPYSWPFICSFRMASSSTHHMCGGNLVRNRLGIYYLITAAHCISQKQPNAYIARCGIHGTNEQFVTLSFSSLNIHPGYNQFTLDNDIAILSLRDQPTSSRLAAVCFPDSTWFEGELGIAAGWGTTQAGGSLPSALRQVTKPIKSRATCEARYGANSITAQMFCAGIREGGIDSCQGDSGGPFYTYRNGKWQLTGLVSWGFGCAEAERPGVYVDVFSNGVYNFINGVIN